MFDLSGQKALVAGVANDQSIAYSCASAFRRQGADLSIPYMTGQAETFVRPPTVFIPSMVVAAISDRSF
jgi:enoyl-[acyl-carrier protein] reductase I